MNRDERRTRARGLPPAEERIGEMRVLLPRDPDAGGTWISVNAAGLCLSLLNRFEDTPHDDPGSYTSRGLLVRGLATARDAAAVRGRLESLTLPDYRPFTLVALGRGGIPNLFEWNGRELDCGVVESPGLVRASSGSDQAKAEQIRGDLFRAAEQEEGAITPVILERLHRSHLPEKGPLSICMHRQEAATVSLSLVTVFRDEVRLRYVDGPPGETKDFLDFGMSILDS